ncbi:MAG TPA: DUF4231 domain-containing protein [Ktedonobacterales bacterium]|jgi:hypothetical protein|nr:DUF4231 domain-containing protein [Ktedonobacterales bacterium]
MGEDEKLPSIMISYSRTDSDFVDRLQADLELHRFNVWVDRRKLESGQEWDAVIQHAIRDCTVLLVVLSPAALDSIFVRKEYLLALDDGKKVIPVRYFPTLSLPPELAKLQVTNLQAGMNFEDRYATGLRQLVHVIDPHARVSMSEEPTIRAGSMLGSHTMPTLFQLSDRITFRQRQASFNQLGAEFALLTLAVIIAMLSIVRQLTVGIAATSILGMSLTSVELADLISAGLLLLALVVRIFRGAQGYEAHTYEALAVAQSVQTLMWRYAMGGHPFPLGGSEAAASTLLHQRIDDTIRDVSDRLRRAFIGELRNENIDQEVKQLRTALLTERKAVYSRSRVEDQAMWYRARARHNRVRSRRWQVWVIVLETLGIAGAVAAAFHLLPFSPAGVVVAVVGGITAWTFAHRYDNLAGEYELASRELSDIAREIRKPMTELEWAATVAEVEGVLAREYRLWRPTRGK